MPDAANSATYMGQAISSSISRNKLSNNSRSISSRFGRGDRGDRGGDFDDFDRLEEDGRGDFWRLDPSEEESLRWRLLGLGLGDLDCRLFLLDAVAD